MRLIATGGVQACYNNWWPVWRAVRGLALGSVSAQVIARTQRPALVLAPNNALLASVSLYTRLAPAFSALHCVVSEGSSSGELQYLSSRHTITLRKSSADSCVGSSGTVAMATSIWPASTLAA